MNYTMQSRRDRSAGEKFAEWGNEKKLDRPVPRKIKPAGNPSVVEQNGETAYGAAFNVSEIFARRCTNLHYKDFPFRIGEL